MLTICFLSGLVFQGRAFGFENSPEKQFLIKNNDFDLLGLAGRPPVAADPARAALFSGWRTSPLFAGMISGSQTPSPTTVNLADEGIADWAHWGLTASNSFNHKSGVPQQIGDYVPIGGGAQRFSNNSNLYSWSGGTPSATVTNTSTGVFITGLNNGFQISVPADTVPKTLKLFVGVWSAGGRLEASLSDGSAPDFVDASVVNPTGTSNAVYTLNFQAGTSGQTLTVRWLVGSTANSNGNITLQAASVVDAADSNPPAVRFEGMRHYLRVSNVVPLSVRAADNVGLSRIELHLDGALIGSNNVSPSATTARVTFNWNSAQTVNGKHVLRASAFDTAGNVQTASLMIITRNGEAPSLPLPTASLDAAPSTIFRGQSATLSWSTADAASVAINQGVGPVAAGGSVTVTPSTTTTYTLTATNAAGSVTKTATVTVNALSGSNIVLNSGVRHQTMGGWETTAEAGQLYSPAWNNYKNALFDQAVNDLGLNRVRLEIRSGSENPTDYFTQWRNGQISESQYNARRYEIVNDNSDPNSINPNGFKWSQLDNTIENVVLPMRQRLQARGETLWVNVNYVDFGSSGFEHKDSPAEYAEFVLATYQHLQSRYGFVPDSWEVVLEPDTPLAGWSSIQMALAIKAAGDRLAANGFVPYFVGPSTTSGANAPLYITQIGITSGAMQYVGEFSYHRYCCVLDTVLQSIVNSTILYNKKAAMLEWIGADYNTLHEDLKYGRNSSWQQFTLTFPNEPDNGAQYYLVDDSNTSNPVVTLGGRTKFLRQYFRFIRSGAQRIEASSGNLNFDPLAFINPNGKYAVVVKAGTGGAFNVQNLPAGTYGIKYTTNSQYDADLADVTITAGQPLTTSIPAAGVLTVYAR